jgi:hypothetical protein
MIEQGETSPHSAKWDVETVKSELTTAATAARLQERDGRRIKHREIFAATKPLEWVAFLPVEDARALLAWLTWASMEGHEDFRATVIPARHRTSFQVIADTLNGVTKVPPSGHGRSRSRR